MVGCRGYHSPNIINVISKIAYQGAKQKFYDYLRDEHHLHLKVSLKSKDGTLSSSLVFFYSPTTECYFVGSHEGAKSTINNFSKLRHVETDYVEIPLKLWQQFDAFYVRHKQSTVLPFAFKYLRECHEIAVVLEGLIFIDLRELGVG